MQCSFYQPFFPLKYIFISYPLAFIKKLQWNIVPAWCFNKRHVSGLYVCGSTRKNFELRTLNSPLPYHSTRLADEVKLLTIFFVDFF
jgi:hypothetical protein